MKLRLVKMPMYIFLITNSVCAAEFSNADICKAAISVEMSRPTKTMKADQQDAEPQISYSRPDGDRFRYICKIEGNRVVWRTFLNDTKSWGRWRDSESYGDAITTFTVAGGTLKITNDQLGQKAFRRQDF